MRQVSNEADVMLHNLPNNLVRQASGGLLTSSSEDRITYNATPSSQDHCFISYLVEETAHRVRNPLTVVKGFVQLYKDDPQNIPWDLLLDEVSGIEKTLQDLMILSRNYRYNTERVNLNQVIAELFPTIEATARQQGVWLELYLDRSPVNIKADPERIATLINHLITNAFHAMPEGGILTIRTMSSKSRVTLQMTDSGVVSEQSPSEVGDQLNPSLWLTVCKHVVASLRGSISFNRIRNRGTMVTVTIPRSAS